MVRCCSLMGSLPIIILLHLFLLFCASLSRTNRCSCIGRRFWRGRLRQWRSSSLIIILLRRYHLIKWLLDVVDIYFHLLALHFIYLCFLDRGGACCNIFCLVCNATISIPILMRSDVRAGTREMRSQVGIGICVFRFPSTTCFIFILSHRCFIYLTD